jgi:hypothetical protein
MDKADPGYQLQRDALNDYKRTQEFLHRLIDRKTTWLLTTQGILFAAYGLTLRESSSMQQVADEFRNVAAITGILLAALSLLGVAFLMVSKVMSFVKYRRFFDDKRASPDLLVDRRLQWGVLTWNTPLTLLRLHFCLMSRFRSCSSWHGPIWCHVAKTGPLPLHVIDRGRVEATVRSLSLPPVEQPVHFGAYPDTDAVPRSSQIPRPSAARGNTPCGPEPWDAR